MRVQLEGEQGRIMGAQGIVLEPCNTSLCHVSEPPYAVNSRVRLFADDCLLYREIKKPKRP